MFPKYDDTLYTELFGMQIRKYVLFIFLIGLILSSELYFFWGLKVGNCGQLLCGISVLILSGMKVEEKSFTSSFLFLVFYLYASLYVLDLNLLGRLFSFFAIFCLFLEEERCTDSLYSVPGFFCIYDNDFIGCLFFSGMD